MRRVVLAAVFIAFTLLFANGGFAGERRWQGVAGDIAFQMVYIDEGNSLYAQSAGVREKISLAGSFVSDVYVEDIDADGSDEVLFLDMIGASVGGDLRVLYWKNGKTLEVANHGFFANEIRLMRIDGMTYITLWSHDTEELFFCDDVALLKGKKLAKVTSGPVWQGIITSYEERALSEDHAWKKSRYFSYIAMAYVKIGDQKNKERYFEKAKISDPANPFLAN